MIGAGTMGNGIAQVFAQSGFQVQLIDAAAAALDGARGTIEKSLGKFVEKGKLSATPRSGGSTRPRMSRRFRRLITSSRRSTKTLERSSNCSHASTL